MSKSPLVLACLGAFFLLGAEGAVAAPGAETCPVAAPRFEPKLRKRPAPEEARFLGGARLSRPVAAPCLRRAGEALA